MYLGGTVGIGHVYDQLVYVKFDMLGCVVLNFMGVFDSISYGIVVQSIKIWHSTMVKWVTKLVDVNEVSWLI